MGDETIYLVCDFIDDGAMKIYGVYPEQLFELAKQHALLVAQNNYRPSDDWSVSFEFREQDTKDTVHKEWAWHVIASRVAPVPPVNPNLVLQYCGRCYTQEESHIIELKTMDDIPSMPLEPYFS